MKHFFRIRMQANKWWVYVLNAEGKELTHEHIGPMATFKEATDAAEATGLIDMDKSEFPKGGQLQ
jgi:hypothetical protein